MFSIFFSPAASPWICRKRAQTRVGYRVSYIKGEDPKSDGDNRHPSKSHFNSALFGRQSYLRGISLNSVFDFRPSCGHINLQRNLFSLEDDDSSRPFHETPLLLIGSRSLSNLSRPAWLLFLQLHISGFMCISSLPFSPCHNKRPTQKLHAV